MRGLFLPLAVSLCVVAIGGSLANEAECDLVKHTDRNPECWDTYDTIQDMGDIGQHLVHEAKCQEVVESMIQTGGKKLSPRQTMINIAFATYSSGYAAGASKPADFVQVEMLTFCSRNPDAKLRDF